MLIQIIILLIFIQILILNYLSPAHTIYVYFASIVLWYKSMKDAWVLRVLFLHQMIHFISLLSVVFSNNNFLLYFKCRILPYSDMGCSALQDLGRVPRLMKVVLSKLPCIKYEGRIWKIKGLRMKERQGEQNCFRSCSASRHIYKCFLLMRVVPLNQINHVWCLR